MPGLRPPTTGTNRRRARLVVVGLTVLVGAAFAAGTAFADVSVSLAQLSGTKLRIEGTAIPNRTITVDGVAMGTSDAGGRFKVERDPFTPPADCTVAVNDGSATATSARLSGCTVSSPASLSALSLSPTTVTGGEPATGTVTLTSAAPAGGFVVSLSSNNTAAATVPAGVTVPAGSARATFTVSTNTVSNSQSSTIIATAGGVTRSSTITVLTPFAASHGSISILPGGNGSGRVTSQPAGIDCTIVNGNGDPNTTCNAFFSPGTVVKLDARPAPDTSFVGWRGVGCAKGEVTVAANVNTTCQVGFQLKF